MNEKLPELFLSVRQPWAWLIVNGWKNIENRSWPTQVRGRIGIHAAATYTRDDYEECAFFVCDFYPKLRERMPAFGVLDRGGIVGETTILDCVTRHSSEWFFGPYGFVVTDSKPMPFIPCRGALGFFRVQVVGDKVTPIWGKNKRNIA